MYQEIASNKRKTVFLITLFIAIIFAITFAFQTMYQTGYGIFVFAVLVSFFMTLFSYYSGDKLALSTAGAKQIDKQANPYLWNMVENLSITSGLPMPKVYIINDSALNAFATGRDPQHASIAVTTGIIDALENEELEGVLAHELSHIKNYDIRVMMIVIVLVGIIALLADIFTRSVFFRRSETNENTGNLGVILLVVGVVLTILSPLIAELIKLAVSRKREYLADASGSLLTRYPQGLASALEKIAGSTPLRRANHATAHLFIANPFGSNTRKFFSNLFSTHPPIEERIRLLKNMA